MEMTLADYHPAFSDPAVIAALSVAAVVLSLAFVAIFWPSNWRRPRSAFKRVLMQVALALGALVGSHALIYVVVHVWYNAAHNPLAGIVCSHWVEGSYLPLGVAVGVTLVALLLRALRARLARRGAEAR